MSLRILVFGMGLIGLGLFSSCKSSKKAAKAAAKEAAVVARRIENAKRSLMPIANSTSSLTMDEQQAVIDRVTAMGLEDDEINGLLVKSQKNVNDIRSRALGRVEGQAKRTTGTRGQPASGYTPKARVRKVNLSKSTLYDTFNRIVRTSSNVKKNDIIDGILDYFSSEDVLLLLIISESNGIVDYDKPTTIGKYLDYLKDTGQKPAKVKELIFDQKGKVKEIVLTSK